MTCSLLKLISNFRHTSLTSAVDKVKRQENEYFKRRSNSSLRPIPFSLLNFGTTTPKPVDCLVTSGKKNILQESTHTKARTPGVQVCTDVRRLVHKGKVRVLGCPCEKIPGRKPRPGSRLYPSQTAVRVSGSGSRLTVPRYPIVWLRQRHRCHDT